jgi:hypothetical protein
MTTRAERLPPKLIMRFQFASLMVELVQKSFLPSCFGAFVVVRNLVGKGGLILFTLIVFNFNSLFALEMLLACVRTIK